MRVTKMELSLIYSLFFICFNVILFANKYDSLVKFKKWSFTLKTSNSVLLSKKGNYSYDSYNDKYVRLSQTFKVNITDNNSCVNPQVNAGSNYLFLNRKTKVAAYSFGISSGISYSGIYHERTMDGNFSNYYSYTKGTIFESRKYNFIGFNVGLLSNYVERRGIIYTLAINMQHNVLQSYRYVYIEDDQNANRVNIYGGNHTLVVSKPYLNNIGHYIASIGKRIVSPESSSYTTTDISLAIGKRFRKMRIDLTLAYRLNSYPSIRETRYINSQHIGGPVAPVLLTNFKIITYGVAITI